jgi:ankyrin repeat protein
VAKRGEKGRLARLLTTSDAGSSLQSKEPVANDTALHWAVRAKHNEVLVLLLANCSSDQIDSVNRHGYTALHIAAWSDNRDAARLLVEKHANMNIEDAWGSTPLSIAQSKWYYDFVILLCAAGADLSTEGLDLKTMLFRAVELDNVSAAEKLIEADVDILSSNDNGQTALDVAMEKGEGFEELCLLLRRQTLCEAWETKAKHQNPMCLLLGECYSALQQMR